MLLRVQNPGLGGPPRAHGTVLRSYPHSGPHSQFNLRQGRQLQLHRNRRFQLDCAGPPFFGSIKRYDNYS
jgi:hypothetical protein